MNPVYKDQRYLYLNCCFKDENYWDINMDNLLTVPKTPSHVIVLGAGVAGCGTALELANAGYIVTLVEILDGLLDGTSQRMPCRLGLGFHYIDIQTAIKNLHATLALVKKYPGFRLGEEFADTHRLKRGRYFIVEDSQFSAAKVLEVYSELKEAYRKICEQDESNQVFGDPENFFRVLDADEYPEINGKVKPVLGIETAECILDWSKIKQFMIKQISEHPRIQVHVQTKVTDITMTTESKYIVECEQSNNVITFHGNMVVNCTWHNIEVLNAKLGIQYPIGHRTQRLKAMAEIEVPNELLETQSALFSFGPHAAFTNLGNGRGFLTYEPVTNVESSKDISLSMRMEELMKRASHRQSEISSLGEAIITGATNYLPALKNAKLLNVHFGIVRSFGNANIFERESKIHERRESGVEQCAPGYIINGSMKLTYFVLNAQEVLSLIKKFDATQAVKSLCVGNIQDVIPNGLNYKSKISITA
jgi:hypothetical protein